MIDDEWIKSLHVQAMHRAEAHRDRQAHVLFQASTVVALLEGAYDGDLTFAELAEHGDLGLGTLNGLDGEMIALDGVFYRADAEGRIHAVEPEAKTPFAVVAGFESKIEHELTERFAQIEVLDLIDRWLDDPATPCAIRIDGRFATMKMRSVPAQSPPYRPLTEVVAEQNVFELSEVEGTVLGFRFPTYVEAIEVGGYHLHFIDAERLRGGHVLDFASDGIRVQLDPSNDLHIELPPGVDLADPDLSDSTHEAVTLVEGGDA